MDTLKPDSIPEINLHIQKYGGYPVFTDFKDFIEKYQNGTLKDMIHISELKYWDLYYVAYQTNNLNILDDYNLSSLVQIYNQYKKHIIEKPLDKITIRRITELIDYINENEEYPPESKISLFIQNLIYLYKTKLEHNFREIVKIPYWKEFMFMRDVYKQNKTKLDQRMYKLSDFKNCFISINSSTSVESKFTFVSDRKIPIKPIPIRPIPDENMFSLGIENGTITFEIIKRYRDLNITIPKKYEDNVNLIELKHHIQNKLSINCELMVWLIQNKHKSEVQKIRSDYKSSLLDSNNYST